MENVEIQELAFGSRVHIYFHFAQEFIQFAFWIMNAVMYYVATKCKYVEVVQPKSIVAS